MTKTTEWCSICDEEHDYDVINGKVTVKCKGCGEPIVLCSLCSMESCLNCLNGSNFKYWSDNR